MGSLPRNWPRPRVISWAISPWGWRPRGASAGRCCPSTFTTWAGITCKGYCDKIRDVTLKTAAQAARDHLHPDALVTLVMGPAAQCAEALKELGPVQTIHEI